MQVDFVPTFSLLLGIPIPFSNIGMVVPELFTHCPWWDTASNEIRRVYHKIKVCSGLKCTWFNLTIYLFTVTLKSVNGLS